MLKLNTSYSKKIPIEGQQYSSQSFHASVEIELSDALKPDEIKTRIHDTFLMVRQSVEEELNGKVNNGNGQQPVNNKPNGNGHIAKASNKQIKFITDLAGQKNIPPSELNAEIKKRFSVDGLYDLSSKQASELLDTLKRGKAA